MLVGHILVCHSVDPEKLFRSIGCSSVEVRWQVFFHGEDENLLEHVYRLVGKNGVVYPYRQNRGLARSWNEGLRASRAAGCELSVILNDDLFFYPEGHSEFVKMASAKQREDPDVSYISCCGLESGNSPWAGQILGQSFACCAISPQTLTRVGFFDEAFVPAYYEDVDYSRRCDIAGMHPFHDPRVLVEHERSSTIRLIDPEVVARDQQRVMDYFKKKWGGIPPIYQTPFDKDSIA